MRDSVAGLIFGNVAEVKVGGFDDGVHSLFTVIVPNSVVSVVARRSESVMAAAHWGGDTICTSERRSARVRRPLNTATPRAGNVQRPPPAPLI